MQNLLGRSFAEKYTDAFAAAALPTDVASIATAVLALGAANAARLVVLLVTPSLEAAMLHVLLWIPLAGALLAWRAPRLRPLVLAWGLFFAVGVAFTTLLYRWGYFVGVRQILPSAALGAVVVGAALAEIGPSRLRARAVVSLVVVWLLAVSMVRGQVAGVTARDLREERIRTLLARAPIPGQGVLIANYDLGIVYLYDHALRTVAFRPHDARTLRLLDERFDVRAALLQRSDLARLPPAALAAAGLRDRGPVGPLRYDVEPDGRVGRVREAWGRDSPARR